MKQHLPGGVFCDRFLRVRLGMTQSVILWGSIVLLSGGCGSECQRRALEGTVTLDRQPLAVGAITYLPLPNTPGPTAGGHITDGKFSIARDKGTFVGTFRVEITATRLTGKKMQDRFTGEMVDESEQFIPARYNRDSELTAEVTADGPNQFEFNLDSQPKT